MIGKDVEGTDDPVVRAPAEHLGDPASSPCCATDFLGELGQVIWPFCALETHL